MRLEKLLTDTAELMKKREYIEVDPRTFSEALKTSLGHMYQTEPEAVRPKALEMAAEHGMHFQSWMYPNGRTCILFSPLGSPMSRMTQIVTA